MKVVPRFMAAVLVIGMLAYCSKKQSTSAAPEAGSPMHGGAMEAKNDTERIQNFLTLCDSMAATLADSDLSGFNEASMTTMGTTEQFVEAARKLPGAVEGPKAIPPQSWADLLNARHLHGFDDLDAARHGFLSFSNAAMAVLQPLAQLGGLPPFKVYESPLAGTAWEGMADSGRWLQTGNRAPGNPFGSSPGTEVGP